MKTEPLAEEELKSVICPRCVRVISQISGGTVRQQCPKCKEYWVARWLAEYKTFYLALDREVCNNSTQAATL